MRFFLTFACALGCCLSAQAGERKLPEKEAVDAAKRLAAEPK